MNFWIRVLRSRDETCILEIILIIACERITKTFVIVYSSSWNYLIFTSTEVFRVKIIRIQALNCFSLDKVSNFCFLKSPLDLFVYLVHYLFNPFNLLDCLVSDNCIGLLNILLIWFDIRIYLTCYLIRSVYLRGDLRGCKPTYLSSKPNPICVCVCIYIYIYIYIEREREMPYFAIIWNVTTPCNLI